MASALNIGSTAPNPFALPVHESVDPSPSVTAQSLPPPHVTVLFVPVSMVQSLVPVHVAVQFDSQVALQVD